MNGKSIKIPVSLVLGDAIVMVVITLVGFANHNELASAGARLLTTFLPLCAAWGLTAPWLGLYQREFALQPGQIWRPLVASILAAPLAGWLRGIWLNTSIIPIFVFVLMIAVALGMVIWREIWALIARRQVSYG